MTSQDSVRIEEGQAWFDFECPGCGATGKLGVPLEEKGPFGCPAGCGSTFLKWRPDPNQQELYRLTCVVQLVVEFDDDNDIVISEDADATNEREAEA